LLAFIILTDLLDDANGDISKQNKILIIAQIDYTNPVARKGDGLRMLGLLACQPNDLILCIPYKVSTGVEDIRGRTVDFFIKLTQNVYAIKISHIFHPQAFYGTGNVP